MRLCIFSGSSPGRLPVYAEMATQLGQALAEAGIGLVYGGASVGLMGAVADAALASGGEVIGVMPAFLAEKELAHTGLQDLRIVSSMHERKALMADLSDGFIALPGGIGTFEELFEVWTWAQLGQHPVSDLVRTPTSPVVGVGCPHHVTHAQGPRLFADAVIGQTVWRPEQLDLSDPIGSKGVIGAAQLPHDLFGPQGKQIGVIPGV